MSKQQLPTQKGTELWPSPTRVPAVFRYHGIDLMTPEGRALHDHYKSVADQFYLACAQNYALSVNDQMYAQQSIDAVLITYKNEFGRELVDVWFPDDMPLPRQLAPVPPEEEKESPVERYVVIDVFVSGATYEDYHTYDLPEEILLYSEIREFHFAAAVDLQFVYDPDDDTTGPQMTQVSLPPVGTRPEDAEARSIRLAGSIHRWNDPPPPVEPDPGEEEVPVPETIWAPQSGSRDEFYDDPEFEYPYDAGPLLWAHSAVCKPEIEIDPVSGKDVVRPITVDILAQSWNRIVQENYPDDPELAGWQDTIHLKVRVREYPVGVVFRSVSAQSHDTGRQELLEDGDWRAGEGPTSWFWSSDYIASTEWEQDFHVPIAPMMNPGMGTMLDETGYESRTVSHANPDDPDYGPDISSVIPPYRQSDPNPFTPVFRVVWTPPSAEDLESDPNATGTVDITGL